jgi:hypothetical protein
MFKNITKEETIGGFEARVNFGDFLLLFKAEG